MKERLEHINRAGEKGYIKYMLKRPHYFEMLAGLKATKETISTFFRKMKREGLVSNPNPPKYATIGDVVSVFESFGSSGRKG